MQAKFDQKHPLSYGYYYCPWCMRAWYDTFAFHAIRCEREGMEDCVYVFGPNENIGLTPVHLRDQVSELQDAQEVVAKAT